MSARNDWTGWLAYCLQGTLKQAKETIHRCERLLAIRESFAAKLANCKGSFRLKRIIDDVFHSPFVRIKDLPQRLGITYPTAKQDVQRLVEAGILKRLPNAKPQTYYAPEVYAVAYERLDDQPAE